MIGTFFLWMLWPSFNFGASANNIYDQNFIVANTYYSLTGSCLSTFMMSALLGSQIAMVDVLNSTLAGGVIIDISSGFLYQPDVAIAIGIVGGIVSTLGFKYLSPFL
jgi:ammonium transporter Rh